MEPREKTASWAKLGMCQTESHGRARPKDLGKEAEITRFGAKEQAV